MLEAARRLIEKLAAAALGAARRATESIDPDYFDGRRSWEARLRRLEERDAFRSPFKSASLALIPRILTADEPGLRAVINMGAGSLCGFLEQGRYMNAYERPRVEGKKVGPSKQRLEVDRLLFGERAAKHYFGAVSLGGTGCRFYGEYCVVVDKERSGNSQVFDRNSYDLLGAPLSEVPDRQRLAETLKGRWKPDVTSMLTAKIAPELHDENRLTTPGQVSDLILRDEDFAEVHLEGDVTRAHVEEVRTSPEDVVLSAQAAETLREGKLPDAATLVWHSWRAAAADSLLRHGVATRTVSVAGRGTRWR